MAKHYDITVVFDEINPEIQAKLMPYVQCIKNSKKVPIVCDSIIVNSVYDKIPRNIAYKTSIQMVHGCKSSTARSLPTEYDYVVCVSDAVKASFGEEAKDAVVIRNMTAPDKVEKVSHKSNVLRLITASRLNTDPKWEDKGASRMIQLANMLREKGIKFEWGYYAESPIQNTPEGVVFHKAVNNIKDKIAEADYLVQLSSAEAFCYSVVEALEIGTPVIVTDLPVFKELKIKDGENGYIVPLDMDFDVEKIKDIPQFKYTYNNGTLVTKWKKLLGKSKPTHSYKPEKMLLVRVTTQYRDIAFNKILNIGDKVLMPEERAKKVVSAGFGMIEEV